ncbi:uncharacterized protein LOC141592161 isoform X2 [Silene latifolia]|uniref:uncharacterized protein LOC141592161 isoform X2 n=1 Tax=Silene latifolia TaxID=37657 RepID=UPI003D771E34
MNISSQVKEEPWIAEDAYGVSETSHKWAESEYAYASALYLDANFEEAFRIDDVSSVFHYDSIANLVSYSKHLSFHFPAERLTSNMTEHDDECRVSNRLLCEDEIANLTLAVCFPKLSEDSILDIDSAKKVPELDFKFCDDELSFGNPRSALNSPETSNEVVGVSEFSIPPPKGLRDTASEIHDVTGNKNIDGTVIEDGTHLNRSEDRRSMNCSTVCGKQRAEKAIKEHYSPSDEVNRVNHLMEAEDLLINYCSGHGPCGLVTSRQKRLCRPPKKYAEESPISKPKRVRGRPKKFPTSSSRCKYLGAVSNQKKFHATSERETLKELDTDDDYTPNESSFRSQKYNKLWKLDEVVKLVDGIAKYGQGQWTAIQKTFFPSACRSPTDIRDKWRNLVKSNSGIRKKKGKDQHLRNGLLALPDTIIERIRELDQAIPNCRSEQKGELSDSRCYETNLSLPD